MTNYQKARLLGNWEKFQDDFDYASFNYTLDSEMWLLTFNTALSIFFGEKLAVDLETAENLIWESGR